MKCNFNGKRVYLFKGHKAGDELKAPETRRRCCNPFSGTKCSIKYFCNKDELKHILLYEVSKHYSEDDVFVALGGNFYEYEECFPCEPEIYEGEEYV